MGPAAGTKFGNRELALFFILLPMCRWKQLPSLDVKLGRLKNAGKNLGEEVGILEFDLNIKLSRASG